MSEQTKSQFEGVKIRELKAGLYRLYKNPLLLTGLVITLALMLIAIFAPVLAPYSPTEQIYADALEGPSSTHFFGTDDIGRDIFSRVLFGYRIVFTITIVGVTGAFIAGTSLGLVAGYHGEWIDDLVMRSVDVLMSFPSLVLALALISAIGPSMSGIAVVLSITYTPIFARVARSESVSVSEEEFIKGLQVRGLGDARIIFRHILPNIMGPILVTISIQLAFGILTTATLSFLGVGVQPPTPSLGKMVVEGTDFMGRAWWMIYLPGISIVLPIIGFTAIGEGTRDSFDPKQSRG